MNMRKVLLITLGLYIASTGVSFAAFSMLNTQSQDINPVVEETSGTDETGSLAIDPSEPKDQPCPISGKMYTKTEKAAWEQKRPLAVMIENHPEARPQSGLIRADVVFEALAEGGVTRFMGIYYCDAVREEVVLAPIRSARTYFIDWASGFNYPLYVHVGGANTPGPADALGQLTDYGWTGQNDINQFSIGYPTFKRDYNRLEGQTIATEHTMVSSTEKLWEAGEEREWTKTNPDGDEWADGYTPWKFKEGDPGAGETTKISYDFWDGFSEYGVSWSYDESSNTYKRTMAEEPHMDLETDEQIAVTNVVVLFAEEEGPIDELKHMLYGTTGRGTALVFHNGEATEVSWSKPDREDQIAFTYKGKPFEFVQGKIWISVVDEATEVSY